MQCSACNFVQLKESIRPSFYEQYRFLSGVASGYKEHLSAIARDLASQLPPASHVIEIGASDGTLLDYLRSFGFSVVGFEPAFEPAQRAQQKGLPIISSFFNRETARLCPFRPVDVVVVRHVLEHLDDFDAIFSGLNQLVSPQTLLLVEVPDLTSTVELSIYSNIYHLHPCYFDIASLSQLLARYGWCAMGSKIVDVFGGSLFLWAHQVGAKTERVMGFRTVRGSDPVRLENADLHAFLAAWKTKSHDTRRFFDDFRKQGTRVAGYGAAERTTSLLGTAGLTSSHIQAIYDRNPALEGLAMPGSGIPIRKPEALLKDRPEYLVIFARSFEVEIVQEFAGFRASGGRFISTRSLPPLVLEQVDHPGAN